MKKIIFTFIFFIAILVIPFKVDASVLSAQLKGFDISNQWTSIEEVIEPAIISKTAIDGSLTTGTLIYWTAAYKYYNQQENAMYILITLEGIMTPSKKVYDHTFRNREMKLIIENTASNAPITRVSQMNTTSTATVNDTATISFDSEGKMTSSASSSYSYSEIQIGVTITPSKVTTIFTNTKYSNNGNTTASINSMVFKDFVIFKLTNYSNRSTHEKSMGYKASADAYFFRDGLWNNKTTNAMLEKNFTFTV